MVIRAPVECPTTVVPNQGLLRRIVFVDPIPTPSILIISSSILIKSPPKNDVIPVKYAVFSDIKSCLDNEDVIALDTTGDWIKLSIATITFAFWLVALKVWEDPIPTEVKLRTSGIDFNAFWALEASLIKLLLTFTT